MKRWALTFVLLLVTAPSWAQDIRYRGNYFSVARIDLGRFGDGTAAAPSITFTSDTDNGVYLAGANLVGISSAGTLRLGIGSTTNVYNGILNLGNALQVTVRGDDADTLAQRQGTDAQKFEIYGTFTDASNYERGFLSAGSTGLIVGHQAAGTGTKRDVRIQGNAKNVAIFSGTAVTMTDETAVTVMTVTVPDNSMCQVTFEYGNIVVSASEYQGHDGTVSLLVGEDPDAAGSYACSVEEETEHVLASAGTLTDSWTCTAGASTVVQGNFNSTLDVAGALTLNVTHSSGCVITIP